MNKTRRIFLTDKRFSVSNPIYGAVKQQTEYQIWPLRFGFVDTWFFTLGILEVIAFERVPDPLTPRAASQSWKHDMYLTHVPFSSSFMSELLLWCCLFGVNVTFQLQPSGKVDWFKSPHYDFSLQGSHASSTLMSKSPFLFHLDKLVK